MRRVAYKDTAGRWSVREVPDSAPDDHAAYGILVGPPDVSSLNLPEEVETRLNNELYARGLITARDVRSKSEQLRNAIQSALRLDVQNLMTCYTEVQSDGRSSS